mmetsp:Transcript_17452/g.24536  ORF Transcript_17452/g.24536 Transcript_17452/m.24536 type:complete len:250 (-) Transcript_17452:342-1091(-)
MKFSTRRNYVLPIPSIWWLFLMMMVLFMAEETMGYPRKLIVRTAPVEEAEMEGKTDRTLKKGKKEIPPPSSKAPTAVTSKSSKAPDSTKAPSVSASTKAPTTSSSTSGKKADLVFVTDNNPTGSNNYNGKKTSTKSPTTTIKHIKKTKSPTTETSSGKKKSADKLMKAQTATADAADASSNSSDERQPLTSPSPVHSPPTQAPHKTHAPHPSLPPHESHSPTCIECDDQWQQRRQQQEQQQQQDEDTDK